MKKFQEYAGRKEWAAALSAKLGGRNPTVFLPEPTAARNFIELEGRDIATLFHRSDLLVREGRPVFAYVPNQAQIKTPDDFLWMSPPTCTKLHFAVCDTLMRKQEAGDVETRYRVTCSESNKYLINVIGRGQDAISLMAKLHPCKNCLGLLEYEGYDSTASSCEKNDIVISFDGKKARLEFLWRLEAFRQQTLQVLNSSLENACPKHWKAISYRHRRQLGFKCESCGAAGSRITLSYHKNGDYSDVRDSNLFCLCKLCYQQLQPTYRVSDADAFLVVNKRAYWRRIIWYSAYAKAQMHRKIKNAKAVKLLLRVKYLADNLMTSLHRNRHK